MWLRCPEYFISHMVSDLEFESRGRFNRWRVPSFEAKGILREMAKSRDADVIEKKILDVGRLWRPLGRVCRTKAAIGPQACECFLQVAAVLRLLRRTPVSKRQGPSSPGVD